MENKIKVYIKIDEMNCITQINSSIFLSSIENYIQIDEGHGDKYSHAQSNYLNKPLIDSQGRYNYKYIDNKVSELTEEEKESLFPVQETKLTEQELLIANLIKANVEQQNINSDLLKQIADLKGGK